MSELEREKQRVRRENRRIQQAQELSGFYKRQDKANREAAHKRLRKHINYLNGKEEQIKRQSEQKRAWIANMTSEEFTDFKKKNAKYARDRRTKYKWEDPEKYARLLENQRRCYRKTATPESRRKWAIKHWYGITPEQEQTMWDAQGGCCASCGDLMEFGKRHIDHVRATRKVRGLLCGHCNLACGHLKDDPNRVIKLATYLWCNN